MPGVALIIFFVIGSFGGGFAMQVPGTRMLVDAEIYIFSSDGTPAPHIKTYTVETISGLTITGVLTADRDGVVRLKGYFCLPMIVAVNGGSVTILPSKVARRYGIRVVPDTLDVTKAFGPIDPTTVNDIDRLRLRCLGGN
jgi:hypothetical protein